MLLDDSLSCNEGKDKQYNNSHTNTNNNDDNQILLLKYLQKTEEPIISVHLGTRMK